MSSQTQWRIRLPRKRRSSISQVAVPGERHSLAPRPKRLRLRDSADSRSIAAAPAVLRPEGDDGTRQAAKPGRQGCRLDMLAGRLACGRTREAMLLLADARLFHLDGGDELPVRDGGVIPRRGLQAKHGDKTVYILDTFKYRGKPRADVAPILGAADGTAGGVFKLGAVSTVDSAELCHISCGFALEIRGGGRVQAVRRSKEEQETRPVGLGSCALAAMFLSTPQAKRAEQPLAGHVHRVVPQGALDHAAQTAAAWRPHTIYPENRNLGPHFVLDLPLPLEYDARPYRCATCKHDRQYRRGEHRHWMICGQIASKAHMTTTTSLWILCVTQHVRLLTSTGQWQMKTSSENFQLHLSVESRDAPQSG